MDMNVLILLSIMLVTGVISGMTSFQWSELEDKSPLKFILISIVATGTIPLFLKTISSQLVSPGANQTPDPTNYLVFAGLCLIAGMSAPKYLKELASKVLISQLSSDVKSLRGDVSGIEQTVRDVRVDAETAKDLAAKALPQSEVEPPIESMVEVDGTA